MEENIVFADIDWALLLLQEMGGGKGNKASLKSVNLFSFWLF